jgi:hypothetical protein
MAKLYEIASELENLIENYNSMESVDQTPEQQTAIELSMTELSLAFNDKAVSVAKYILNEESDIEAIENEIKRLALLKDRKERKNGWLKTYLFSQMENLGLKDVKNEIVLIKIKNNPPSVVIEDESLIPDEYKRIIPERKEIDKVKIKESWKKGIGVIGTRVENKQSLSIK